MKNLDIIFSKYDTDKNSKFHNYTRQYNNLFTPFYISNADLTTQKNKKKCKINSRNFTYY